MTRQFNARIRCQHCGGLTTEESPMERWIRNHPLLDSSNGIVRFDVDILLHRFKVLADAKGERNIEFMMFIEVKTHSADLTKSQRDTLGLLNQVLRNRRQNMYAKPRRQIDGQPALIYSTAKGKRIPLRLLGGHLLQLSGSDPENSEWMKWDYKPIELVVLIELMLFDRDPDNLKARKSDWMRRRSNPFATIPKNPKLFDKGEIIYD
jgi:hypothetical protein